MDEVAEVSDALMERYLEGEEISHDETVSALKTGVTEGRIFPVTCGVATRNLGINRLLDAFVEDLPSPAKKGTVEFDDISLEPDEAKEMVAFVFKTLADPFAERLNLFRVYQGVMRHDSQVHNCRAHVKERVGQLLVPQGRVGARRRVRARRHRRGREAEGDARRRRAVVEGPGDPARATGDAAPGGLRHRAQGQGDEEGRHGAAAAPRRTPRSTSTATSRPGSRSSPA